MRRSTPALREHSVLVIIDMQEKLFPRVVEKELLAENVVKLISFAQTLGIPIVLTEQYPKGLGTTIAPVRQALDDYRPLEKVSFSCFGAEGFEEKLGGARVLLLTGIETHVCVFQTALDALSKGYSVHVLADAVSSRTSGDKEIGIERMRDSGAIISSTEMAIFEILERAGTEEFKSVAHLLR
ncbi:MAG: hydrolase [Candidatus Thermoplasmatota archaeon]